MLTFGKTIKMPEYSIDQSFQVKMNDFSKNSEWISLIISALIH